MATSQAYIRIPQNEKTPFFLILPTIGTTEWKILAGQFLVSTPAARKAMAYLNIYHLQHLLSTGNIPPTSPLPHNLATCQAGNAHS